MNICVYGASSNKIDQSYIKHGEQLGRVIAERKHTLIFGGGANGLMGAAARGVYEKGGRIIGVAPGFFNVDGILFENCDELIRTETMRERKQKMEDLADGFIMTPGGIGTFEEFFEILTLKQLGRHQKPIAVLDTNGYYDSLVQMMQDAVEGEFMTESCLSLYGIFSSPEEAVKYIEESDTSAMPVSKYKNI